MHPENHTRMKTLHYFITLLIMFVLPVLANAEEADSTGRFEFGMQYDTELQTDFKEGHNFLNLLRLDGSVKLTDALSFHVSTLSIAQSDDNSIANDLQTFSNLEIGGGIPLTIAVAGFEWTAPSESPERGSGSASKFFFGVRNTGEEYFASDVTSFFVNSSSGIFPTISANYPIGTYPFASMALHYEYSSEHWGAKATVYNGEGYYRLAGKESVWRFCPKSDGVFVMAQGELKLKGKREEVKGKRSASSSNLFFGGSLYKNSPTLWTYAEHNIGERSMSGDVGRGFPSRQPRLSLIAAYSHCFDKDALCRNFVGAGAKLGIKKVELGVFSDYADYCFGHEYATELSCRIPLGKHLSVKPSLHYINGTTETGFFGLMRMQAVF